MFVVMCTHVYSNAWYYTQMLCCIHIDDARSFDHEWKDKTSRYVNNVILFIIGVPNT